VIEILILLAIIAGIILVLAELVINVLPELRGSPTVSPANQAQTATSFDRNATGPTSIAPSETNDTR
jgi:hypothetical protein